MFDKLRASHPLLGFALYALQPKAGRGSVTFEVYTPEGEVYSFTGLTAEEAMLKAFPDPHPPPPPTPQEEDIFS